MSKFQLVEVTWGDYGRGEGWKEVYKISNVSVLDPQPGAGETGCTQNTDSQPGTCNKIQSSFSFLGRSYGHHPDI